jgi:hypothetical protein
MSTSGFNSEQGALYRFTIADTFDSLKRTGCGMCNGVEGLGCWTSFVIQLLSGAPVVSSPEVVTLLVFSESVVSADVAVLSGEGGVVSVALCGVSLLQAINVSIIIIARIAVKIFFNT